MNSNHEKVCHLPTKVFNKQALAVFTALLILRFILPVGIFAEGDIPMKLFFRSQFKAEWNLA